MIYKTIVDEIALYDDYVSDNQKENMTRLYNILKQCPSDIKNGVAENIYALIDKNKKYTAIWLYSYCIAISDSNKIFEEFLIYVTELKEISINTRYYLYYQLKAFMFRFVHFQTVNAQILKWKLLDKVIAEFRKELEKELQYIPKNERNENFVLVLTEQILNETHGPTKTALDRCKVLIQKMKKQVLLVNTAEVLSQRGGVSFFMGQRGSYESEHLKDDRLLWKDTTVPFFQCENNMPNMADLRSLLQMVRQMKPGLVVSIGGSSVLANLINDILPVLVVGLTPSELEATMAECQTLSRELTTEDRQILKELEIEPDRIINSVFTSSLQLQNKKISRKEMGIPEDVFVIAVVGCRLDTDIDQEFVELLKEIVTKDVYVVFIGVYEHYQQMLNENLEYAPNLKNLGFTNDILAWLENCDLYLNPRRRGGGTSGVEALFKGVPVITTPYGDVATNVGSDFWVESYKEIPELVMRYRSDKEFYRMMSERAKERAEILLDSETEFVRTIEVFQKHCQMIE